MEGHKEKRGERRFRTHSEPTWRGACSRYDSECARQDILIWIVKKSVSQSVPREGIEHWKVERGVVDGNETSLEVMREEREKEKERERQVARDLRKRVTLALWPFSF